MLEHRSMPTSMPMALVNLGQDCRAGPIFNALSYRPQFFHKNGVKS
jgi:hypothetical protein